MSIAYLLMGAGLLSFAGMGIVHKLGDRWNAQPLGIAIIAMGTASLISLLASLALQGSAILTIPRLAILIAIPFGMSAAVALWLFQKGLRHGHIATSWLLINLSSGVPTVLSLIVYKEPLTPRKLGVFALVIISLLLLWWDRRGQAKEASNVVPADDDRVPI
jgi:EamA domain-containing membrane protein RarD